MKKITLVKDIMSTKLIKLSPEMSLAEAARMFCQYDFSGAPVTDKDDSLVGILSEKDLFQALYPKTQEICEDNNLALLADPLSLEERLKEAGDVQVKDIMTKKIISTYGDEPIIFVGAKMMAKHIHRLPVLENGKLVGLVSRRDIYKEIFKDLFSL